MSILFILTEWASIDDGASISLDMRKASAIKGENKKAEKAKIYDEHKAYICLVCLYWIWLFIGVLMSSQWIWFVALIGMALVGSKITKLMSDKVYVYYKYLDAIVSIGILAWVAFNHFH